MAFYIVIGLVYLSLIYLAFAKPKQVVFILLALLPFSAFLKTSLSHFLSLDQTQAFILGSWKELIILALLIYVVIRAIKEKKLAFKVQSVDWLIIGLAGLMLISFLLSGLNFAALAFGIKYDLMFLILYLVIKSLSFSKAELWQLFKVILVTTLIVVIFSVLQIIFGNSLMTWFGYTDQGQWQPYQALQTSQTIGNQTRIPGTLSGPNQLGVYMAMIGLIILASLKKLVIPKLKKLLYPLLTLVLLVIIFSFSRTAWISLALGFLAMVIYCFTNKVKDKQIQKKYLTIAGAVILVVIILAWLAVNLGWADNILTRHTDFDRKQLLYQSSQLLIDNPLGLGIGQVGPAAQWTKGPDLSVISENNYLQYGLELGLIGLIIYFMIFINWFKTLFKKLSPGQGIKPALVLGTLVAFIAVLISGLFLHTFTDATLMLTLAILLGITAKDKNTKEMVKL